jgi:endonuclease YncB( thermonuclease family)
MKAAFACWYDEYSEDIALPDLQEEARIAKRSLWLYPDPIAPWQWRHRLEPVQSRTP